MTITASVPLVARATSADIVPAENFCRSLDGKPLKVATSLPGIDRWAVPSRAARRASGVRAVRAQTAAEQLCSSRVTSLTSKVALLLRRSACCQSKIAPDSTPDYCNQDRKESSADWFGQEYVWLMIAAQRGWRHRALRGYRVRLLRLWISVVPC